MTATASETAAGHAATAALPDAAAVLARAETENFPVAGLLLPAGTRAHLLHIYGFARLLDEIGDSVQGDRVQALEWLERELDAAFAGRATHPLLVRLQATIRQCGLRPEPFRRLMRANRVDQSTHRYQTWEQLREYCSLSADPVGELVLSVFQMATPERVALSDPICTALQLVEHCQDVAEDMRNGRVYLPQEDMRRFGATLEHLRAGTPTPQPLRDTIAFELDRVRALLKQGAPLIRTLKGRQRLAVAAFHAGGLAAAEAIERAGLDVLAGAPRASKPMRLRALANSLRRGRR